MFNSGRVEKVYTKYKLGKEPSDFSYWQNQPFEARIAALELIRREFHEWKYGSIPRLQRVFTIIKR